MNPVVIEASIEIAAPPGAVYARYLDVAGWAQWDPDTAQASIDGTFEDGTRGRLRPTEGREVSMVLEDVVADESFTVVSKLPGLSMRFEHEIRPASGGVTVTHRARLSGLLLWFVGRSLSQRLREGFPRTLASLKAVVEAQQAVGGQRSDALDVEAFWRLVDLAKSNAGATSQRPEALASLLTGLEPQSVQAFAAHYSQMLSQAYSWPLWGAAYVINGGCSDDGFDYFCDWLISEGKATFEQALEDPDALADLPHIEDAELELFRYAADQVFEQKTGGPMPAMPAGPPSEPNGEPWEEDTVHTLYPRLTAIYG